MIFIRVDADHPLTQLITRRQSSRRGIARCANRYQRYAGVFCRRREQARAGGEDFHVSAVLMPKAIMEQISYHTPQIFSTVPFLTG